MTLRVRSIASVMSLGFLITLTSAQQPTGPQEPPAASGVDIFNYGEVDKTLEAVVSNLLVSNGLDIKTQVRCRVLMTSTFESYAMGRTIVLSRGLLDVLPDEASLAALLAHELGHIVLGHRMDTQFAFFDRIRFDEKNTFRHFAFSRPPEEELRWASKAMRSSFAS